MGTEKTSISVPNDHFDAVEAGCRVFNCQPYFAFVVDGGGAIRGFLAPIDVARGNQGASVTTWKMTAQSVEAYASDERARP